MRETQATIRARYAPARNARLAVRKANREKGAAKASLLALFNALAGIAPPEPELRFYRFARVWPQEDAYAIGYSRKLALLIR